MNVVLPFVRRSGPEICTACGRLRALHSDAQGRSLGCVQDVKPGVDVMGSTRRLRLALLQSRVLKVQPFGIEVER